MHLKADNIEIMINYETDMVVSELSDSFKKIYKKNLESVKGNDFVFDYVQLL